MGRIAMKSNIINWENRSGPWFGIYMDQERSTTNEWVMPTISSTREPHNQNYILVEEIV